MDFETLIAAACHKKEQLINRDFWRYGLRAVYAGMYLTLTTAVGAHFAMAMAPGNAPLAGIIFAFVFAFGLAFILFLGGELVTSNMMYLTAGLYFKKVSMKDYLKILIVCTVFNLIGALFIAWLFSFMPSFSQLPHDFILAKTVGKKLTKPVINWIMEGIIANIFVNLAVLSFALIKNQVVRLVLVVTAVTMFVGAGTEHVAANFSSFSILFFAQSLPDIGLTIPAALTQWLWVWLGNWIGGALVMGLGYAYLNRTATNYRDKV